MLFCLNKNTLFYNNISSKYLTKTYKIDSQMRLIPPAVLTKTEYVKYNIKLYDKQHKISETTGALRMCSL